MLSNVLPSIDGFSMSSEACCHGVAMTNEVRRRGHSIPNTISAKAKPLSFPQPLRDGNPGRVSFSDSELICIELIRAEFFQ